MIRFEKLSLDNFDVFADLTSQESGGGCFCSFWHQKWPSRAGWDQQCKTNPEKNKETVFKKVQDGFHLGVLAYENDQFLGWISVGPVTDFYWAWPRVGQLGIEAKEVAGIVCIAIEPSKRKRGLQAQLLEELAQYGKTQNWKRIEGYPFDQSARDKHGEHVLWPGLTEAFTKAGYQKLGPHWLNNPEAERSIFSIQLM